MPNIDYDKLQDALERIKMTCEGNQEEGGCAQCPLGASGGDCMLRKMPKQWNIRHPETDVFRMLG